MGLFCANVHVVSEESDSVRDALGAQSDVEVLPVANGWVSIYAARLIEQGADAIEPLAAGLSRRLGTRAVSFWLYDSDIACYWLHENGELIDHHNSWPDYFDGEPRGGRGSARALAEFCGPDYDTDDLERMLSREVVFADDIVADVARALGIDPERALMDQRDISEEALAQVHSAPTAVDPVTVEATILGKLRVEDDYPPEAISLVRAAAGGDEPTLRRLVADGISVDTEAPTPLPGSESLAGLGLAITGGRLPEIVVTPLLAAIMNSRSSAAAVLLELGADPNGVHDIYGTPVHAATAAGNPQLLELLLDAGGRPDIRDQQGQTALQVLASSREQLEALEQAQALIQTLGLEVPDAVKQLGEAALPSEGWDACERILQRYGTG
ncbi:MAG: ankyrin repeat domain-containing protein [Acidimicrobiia bacterium]|nr:ankyrin repeat domain-containing protein [Acidimicrobiia bacterium]